jgi:hypothetical protein
MTLTAGNTQTLPWGLMEAVAGLRLSEAVDRCGEYVLFRKADEHYVVIGPWENIEIASGWWFGNGWGCEVEECGDISLAHIRPLPHVLFMHRPS